jgi:hypothetical protein
MTSGLDRDQVTVLDQVSDPKAADLSALPRHSSPVESSSTSAIAPESFPTLRAVAIAQLHWELLGTPAPMKQIQVVLSYHGRDRSPKPARTQSMPNQLDKSFRQWQISQIASTFHGQVLRTTVLHQNLSVKD